MDVLHAERVFPEAESYRVHVVRAGGAYNFVPHTHRGFCELTYVQSGELKETINGRTYEQQEGTLTLIRESDTHVLRGSRFTMTNVAFRSYWWQQLARLWDDRHLVDELLRAPRPLRCRIPEDQRPAFEAELHLLLAAQGDGASRVPFSRFLVTVLHDRLLAPTIAPAHSASSCPDWLAEALVWVEARGEGVPSLGELLSRCGRCREHVARSFRKHLGLTPSQFLNRQRLKRAVILLKQTNYPVLNISYESGFDSPAYFHKLFKEVYDTSPRQYRVQYGYRPPEERLT